MADQVRQASYTDYSNSYNEMLFVIRQRMAELQTALPVKVIAVKPNDGHTGFVDVQPLVQQISADSTVVDHGIIYNVPYFRLQGGINGIIIDPAVGDIGLCDFCSRDISAVKNSKQIAPPASRRIHSFSDAIYIGGLLNAAPTRFIEFNNNGINVVPIEKFTYNSIEVATINDVANERARAEAAESITSDGLAAEKKRAMTAEESETFRAVTEETFLQNEIDAEISRAKAAEAAELARATAAEAAETAARIAADAVLTAAIVAETTRAQAAESTLTANLNAESTRAQNAESVLNVNIVAETTRATSAESTLNININDEKTRAQSAESSLAAAISTLGGEVSAGGAALSADIAAVSSSLSTETSNRTTADADLQTQITTLSGSFTNSKTSNGYQKLPNGLIVQWGNFSSGDVTITFPIAFPNNCLMANGSAKNGDGGSTNTVTLSFNQTTVSFQASPSGGHTSYWIAIGY